jgi:hypothetical protein
VAFQFLDVTSILNYPPKALGGLNITAGSLGPDSISVCTLVNQGHIVNINVQFITIMKQKETNKQ